MENTSKMQDLFDFSSFQEFENTKENINNDNSENDIEKYISISDNDTEDTEEIIEYAKNFMEDSENDIEEFITDLSIETDSVDLEDLQGASFEDAVKETLNNDIDIPQWPNEIYQEFAKICVDNDLSNNVTDSFIQFFNKNANIKESPLPKNSKEMHKFMNTLVAPNLDFKKKHIINFEDTEYFLYYRPIIKTIKALLQKSDIIEDFVFQFEKKQKVNMVSNLTF